MDDRINAHRGYAFSDSARSSRVRSGHLETLHRALVDYRAAILEALERDLRKPRMEAFASEFGPVIHEIEHARRRLRRWMRPRSVGWGRRIEREAMGAALVIGTWNYPVQLALSPVVAALAAGNGVTLKPSEVAPATSGVLRSMIADRFAPEVLTVVEGDAAAAIELIDSGYDTVFFTGSSTIGAKVAARAAAHHSRVTLELGGKSPAIVGADADAAFVAGRVAWGKFLNAGQTCMAPDYLLVPAGRVREYVSALREAVRSFYGAKPAQSPDYARIVSTRHHDRLVRLAGDAGIEIATGNDDRFFPPTIVEAAPDSPLMHDEIFGPILPVVAYATEDDLFSITGSNPNPLAAYVFSSDREFVRRVLARVHSGGAMINDLILHTTDPRLPFGGRGSSGTGAYHGKHGFDAFTHYRTVVRKRAGGSRSMRYPPYRELPPFVRKALFGL